MAPMILVTSTDIKNASEEKLKVEKRHTEKLENSSADAAHLS